MTTITIDFNLSVDDVCRGMELADIAELLSLAANKYAEAGLPLTRRDGIEAISENCSELGRRFLCELAACIFSRRGFGESTTKSNS